MTQDDKSDRTPLLVPQGVSRDTLYLVEWIDRKIDGVYERIETRTTALANRITMLSTSLASCQATHKTEAAAGAAEQANDIRRRDRIEKYAVPIIVAAVTSFGAFLLGRLTSYW